MNAFSMQRIYLLGFMGSGKSTLGVELAASTGYRFVDLDHEIEIAEGASIPEIFSTRGEEYFRLAEKRALERTFGQNLIVVAAGGGTPCFHGNMDAMNRNGLTVYLRVPEEVLLERLVREKDHRPLISHLTETGLKEFIRERLEERKPFYLMSGHILQYPFPQASAILQILGQ